MAKTSNINVRIDPDVKQKAEALFSNFGMNVSDAINIFLHQSIIYGGLPFQVKLDTPNAETQAAISEADDMLSGKVPMGKLYTNVDEMMKELLD